MIEGSKLRQALSNFLGEDQFTKMVRQVAGRGRFLYWHEKELERFTKEHPEFATSVENFFSALRICELHGEELVDCSIDVQKSCEAEKWYKKLYVETRSHLFPHANSGLMSSVDRLQEGTQVKVAYCPACRNSELEWLAKINFSGPPWLDADLLSENIPLKRLLSDSVYYPAAGIDSDPIFHLGRNFWSFIFCDYGYTQKNIETALAGDFVDGLKLLEYREVTEEELPLRHWNSETHGNLAYGLPIENNAPPFFQRGNCPFAHWALFERNSKANESRDLISLLYIGADGVELFDKLYVENRISPACICLIQAPPAMGGFNWTNFEDEQGIFARKASHNPAGGPNFILYGGSGNPEWYKKPCWSNYDKCLAFPLSRYKGSPSGGALSLWERNG